MNSEEKRSWLDRPIHPTLPAITIEVVIFVVVILLTIVSRFYNLGARVMSHDESLHTYFSWLLYKGQGYQHSPMMHGPAQFHFLALAYYIFGVSDFTARIPAALFSIATVGMVWYWRRYLGRVGALVAGVLMLISPYMLYYGRYVRNEAFVGLFGIIMLYAILRHIETGKSRYLYMLTVVTVLHFAAKETSFIYVAQALLFLGFYLVYSLINTPWRKSEYLAGFLGFVVIGAVLILGGTGLGFYYQKMQMAIGTREQILFLGLTGLGFASIPIAVLYLVRGVRWNAPLQRSFNLLVLLLTMTLPQLAPFPVKAVGWDPLDYSTLGIWHTAGVMVFLGLVTLAIGLLWNWEEWLKNTFIFYGIFITLYTTVFTNGEGFFTGMIGSLGYWMAQQGVQRGSQPWYFYLLVQIPMYEFLPALGSLLALGLVIWRSVTAAFQPGPDGYRTMDGPPEPGSEADLSPETVAEADELSLLDRYEESEGEADYDPQVEIKPPALILLAWWIVVSIIAFTFAGEKMPWLTYHMAWPMILLSGWAIGQLIKKVDWAALKQNRGPLAILLVIIFGVSIGSTLNILFGPNLPFQGSTLAELQTTATFTLSALVALSSAAGTVYLMSDLDVLDTIRTVVLTFFLLLTVLTARASIRASYYDYDQATEYLVYAHAARGVKDVIAQATEISQRTTGGMGVALAYDASAPDTGVSWPFVWYLRDFTNQISFDAPTRSLRDRAIIIVDQKNFSKIEPVVGNAFYRFDYTRMWWPNQDYFNLTPDRFWGAIKDPKIRQGIFDIWLNRDYTAYAEATGGQTFTLPTWEPSDRMRLYIRKDIAQQIWNYGIEASTQTEVQADPYEQNTIKLVPDMNIGVPGTANGQFNAPRGLAFAQDGSFYVADSRNNRIQHFAADGTFINAWGSYANIMEGEIPPGTFNEPWGVAVGPDGSVYVTDTWNHRIQKFTPDGQFIMQWGTYGLGDTPDAMWGPRGIAVSQDGRVFVTDTGNKRVVVFDQNGQAITEFGMIGFDPGQFDEPVGIAVGTDGTVYVADTWNQRIQTFTPSADGQSYFPTSQWDVAGWYGEGLENKPFIAVDGNHVFITDPELYRVIEFDTQGHFIQAWGSDLVSGGFGYMSGIAVDPEGHVWVSDPGNNRIMRFTLP